jgi:ribosomal protein S18 acetylase RimI-like enzyme
LKYGEVYSTSPNYEGIAIWIPPGDGGMTAWRMFRSRSITSYLKTGLKNIPRMVKASKSQSIHKELVKENHWYLQNIGVDPPSQGKGFAGELLISMLSRIDKDKLPCYLETNNEKNISFYKKYGFEVLDRREIPQTGVINWSMLRKKVC